MVDIFPRGRWINASCLIMSNCSLPVRTEELFCPVWPTAMRWWCPPRRRLPPLHHKASLDLTTKVRFLQPPHSWYRSRVKQQHDKVHGEPTFDLYKPSYITQCWLKRDLHHEFTIIPVTSQIAKFMGPNWGPHGPLTRYAKLRVRMRRECRERFPRHRR